MHSPPSLELFSKDTLIKGEPARIDCVEICGQTFSVQRGLVTHVALDDEWFHEVDDPVAVIDVLRADQTLAADVFSFCQRLPNVDARFPYPLEAESVAALALDSYDHWWAKQIEGATRNQIRKSRKLGVEVRVATFDDEFVRGMTAIFNESPVRQGRRFCHYGKDAATIKRQFSRYLFREDLIGAYCGEELVGFAMLGRTEHYADLGQIIAKIAHREKSVASALIDKAVAVCAERRIPHLLYAFWSDDTLGQFKRRHGFREVRLPRYVVPLTVRGQLAVRAGLHRGWKALLPDSVKGSLKQARSKWYQLRDRAVHSS